MSNVKIEKLQERLNENINKAIQLAEQNCVRNEKGQVVIKKYRQIKILDKIPQNIRLHKKMIYKKDKDKKMATICKKSNVFDFVVNKGELSSLLQNLDKPSVTKEYLEECRKVANRFRKPSK
jgi:hypothetical protein